MSEVRKPRTKLTVAEKIFAREIVKNKGNQTQAALVATNAKDSQSAGVMGARMMQRPTVKREIAQILSERYPEHEEDFMRLLKLAMERALSGGATIKEINETLNTVATITGHKAPKETHTKSLKATVKLPGSGD